MSVILEDVLVQIKQLPPADVALLRDLLNKGLDAPEKLSRERHLTPIRVPDQSGALKWLAENARAYKGQWVALDGERLIAHGKEAREVYAAARADGAYLPLVELVEDPDAPPCNEK